MKKIVYKYSYGLLLSSIVMTLLLLAACQDDDDNFDQPVITEVRNYASSPDDTVVQIVQDGQWVVVMGENLIGVSRVLFGSVPATVNKALFTDKSIVVQVPSIPFQSLPADAVNEITLISKSGVTTFSINITGPPLISYIRNYDASPNDTIVNSVAPGQDVNLIGFNLKGATIISFQGVNIDLSEVVFTDSSAIMKVPEDFSGGDASLANKITYTTTVGTSTYSIPIFDPALLAYYSDPLYTLLAGGLNQEKTWVLDFDPTTGASKKFKGPMWWTGADLGWWDRVCGPGGNCWIYEDTYQTWMAPIREYGTITFKLTGNPIIPMVSVNQVGLDNASDNGVFSGSYFMDVDAKTITFSDVVPLRVNRDQVWSTGYIFSITEDGLQIGFKDPTKAEYAIYNYISKEYNDQWGPPAENEGFNPKFAPGELLSILTGGATSGRQWKLDTNGNPVDWVNGDSGSGWTSDTNSTWNWGWNDSWVSATQDAWIMFDQFGGNQNYTRHQNGTTTTGTFSIDEATNEITLTTNTLIVNPDSWMSPTTNTIKVVKAYPSDLQSKGIWFGTSYDAGKNEWMVFHYILP